MNEHTPWVAIRLEQACASLEAEVWLLRQQNAALLEALKAIINRFDNIFGVQTRYRGFFTHMLGAEIHEARRAIALARGEES